MKLLLFAGPLLSSTTVGSNASGAVDVDPDSSTSSKIPTCYVRLVANPAAGAPPGGVRHDEDHRSIWIPVQQESRRPADSTTCPGRATSFVGRLLREHAESTLLRRAPAAGATPSYRPLVRLQQGLNLTEELEILASKVAVGAVNENADGQGEVVGLGGQEKSSRKHPLLENVEIKVPHSHFDGVTTKRVESHPLRLRIKVQRLEQAAAPDPAPAPPTTSGSAGTSSTYGSLGELDTHLLDADGDATLTSINIPQHDQYQVEPASDSPIALFRTLLRSLTAIESFERRPIREAEQVGGDLPVHDATAPPNQFHMFTYGDMLNSYLCVLSKLTEQLHGGRLNVLGGAKLRRHSDAVLEAHERGNNENGLDFNIRGSKLEQASRLFKVLTSSQFPEGGLVVEDEDDTITNFSPNKNKDHDRRRSAGDEGTTRNAERAFLAPDDVILVSDGFDVFAQRDLRGLKRAYEQIDETQTLVLYGGEKNCWPTPHHNISDTEFEKRNCAVHRRCPFDNARAPWKLYYLHPDEEEEDEVDLDVSSENNNINKPKHLFPYNPARHQSGGRKKSVLGRDLCYENLKKYSPDGEHLSQKFPYLNAGLSIGSVHALQKLSRRLFRLYKETKQLDDQALLLVLALEKYFVKVEPTGRLFFNAHGYDLGDFAQTSQELCKEGYLVSAGATPPNNSTFSPMLLSSGAGRGSRSAGGQLQDVDGAEDDGEDADHGPRSTSAAAPSSPAFAVPQVRDRKHSPAAALSVTNLGNGEHSPFLIHFNGRGRWYMQRCREYFFEHMLGRWANDTGHCRLFDYENYEYFSDTVLWGEETVFAINFKAENDAETMGKFATG